MTKRKQKNTMKTKTNFRHGDVILTPVSEVKGDPVKGLTLALGEVTGHSHQITSGAAQMFKFNDKTYLRVTSEIACLTHEEHAKIELPAGDYEVFIQEDYQPGGWKKVQD